MDFVCVSSLTAFANQVTQVAVFIQKTFQFINLIVQFKKSEHKLKQKNDNDLIKPILYVSGIKLLKLV